MDILEDKEVVLFDMDGTLVDHFNVIHQCFNYAFSKIGEPPLSYKKVLKSVGGSMPVTMIRLIGEDKAPLAVPYFTEHFNEIFLKEIIILEGVIDFMDKLQKQGKRLGIFTNKQGDITRGMLRHLKLDPYFEYVFGAGDTLWKKPDPEFTITVLDAFNVDSKNACMVGDSPFDFHASACVGVDCILLTTGTHSRSELLKETDSKHIYRNLVEFMALGQNL